MSAFLPRTAAPIALLVACSALAPAQAAETAPAKVEVFPAAVSLHMVRDRQSLAVQAVYPDGTTCDVSAQAGYTLTNPALVRLENGTLYPQADGVTELVVTFEGQSVRVPVTVRNAQVDEPVSFNLDVMPVFMKAGCNSGKCHGSAQGKDGFRLSLFGYDADGDHYRLTRQLPGRRINLARPGDSLLIRKALGQVSHAGGQRFDEGSELHRTLMRWLEAGAVADASSVPTPVALEVLPRQIVLDGKGATQKMTVRARYSDGTDRDVTALALYLSNNDGTATISADGLVTAGERGEAFVMARFATFTEGAQVIVRPKGEPFIFPDAPEHNYIDTLINNKLKKLHVAPSEPCSDEVFLRRAYIDLTGLLPTRQEYERFLADKDPKKRARLVDELLARPDFNELWIMKWAELLQIRRVNGVSPKGMQLYNDWLRARISSGVSIDQVVQEVLAATGGTFQNPAANYYQTETTPERIGENVAQVFLGMRIQCAQCHNHPFDRWTMDDYYGFTAFFGQVGYKQAQDPREITVFNKGMGEVRHPVDNRVAAPRFLGAGAADVQDKDYRAVLAQWLATPENPDFARNLANIVWAHFFGKGIIDPVDDVRVSNPPSNPELLEALGKKAAEYRCDIKQLARDICTSAAYQRSTRRNPSNELDERNFARGPIRRIRAEVLLDCINQVTEIRNKFPGLPLGARAVSLLDGRVPNYFLTTFGRATRETPCSCEVKVEPSLSQALHLINGDTTNEKIVAGKVVQRLLAENKSPRDVVEELYLRCLSRKPTAKEMAGLEARFARGKEPAQDLEDVFWGLLNSKEFIFNH